MFFNTGEGSLRSFSKTVPIDRTFFYLPLSTYVFGRQLDVFVWVFKLNGKSRLILRGIYSNKNQKIYSQQVFVILPLKREKLSIFFYLNYTHMFNDRRRTHKNLL